jgi:phosphomannomutase
MEGYHSQRFYGRECSTRGGSNGHWLLAGQSKATVVLGHDCRFGGELFAETVAKVLCAKA